MNDVLQLLRSISDGKFRNTLLYLSEIHLLPVARGAGLRKLDYT